MEANPETGAEVAPDSSSFDDKLAAKLGFETDTSEPEQAEEAREATPEPVTDELKPDEIAADDAAPDDDAWLEIERKGEKRRLSKEEAKRLAQQGFDYNTQVERLKAEEATLTQLKAAVTQRSQITPQVIDAAANVRSYERALEPYKGVNWAQLALQMDPQQYAQTRAQYDQLRDALGQSVQEFQRLANTAQTADAQVAAAELERQRSRLMDAVPAWRDPQRFKTDAGRIKQYLLDKGVTEEEVARISDSRFVLVALDAMRYDAAVKARTQRESKPAPVLKPGPAPARTDEKTQYRETIKALHQAKDPDRKKALLDSALEKKLARFIPS